MRVEPLQSKAAFIGELLEASVEGRSLTAGPSWSWEGSPF